MGEEHLLLAVAEEVRRETGDLSVSLAAHLERHGPPVPKVHEGCVSGPSFHVTRGRAEGLALAEGDARGAARAPGLALGSEWGPRSTHLLGRADATAPPIPPNPFLAPAEREAVAMGYPFLGAEHVVLALLAGLPDDVAGHALRSCGLEPDSVAAKLLKGWTDGLPPCPPHVNVTSARPNARSREFPARAEGLAGRTGEVSSHHGLIAFLWRGEGVSVFELEWCGTPLFHYTSPAAALNILSTRKIFASPNAPGYPRVPTQPASRQTRA